MIETGWDENATTTYVWRMKTGWTWDDFNGAIDKMLSVKAELVALPNFALIVDMSEDQRLPKGSAFVSIGRGMREMGSENGLVVVVAANHYVFAVIKMVRKATPFGTWLHGVRTLDEARALIIKYRREPHKVLASRH